MKTSQAETSVTRHETETTVMVQNGKQNFKLQLLQNDKNYSAVWSPYSTLLTEETAGDCC